jgi:hypothetical protein
MKGLPMQDWPPRRKAIFAAVLVVLLLLVALIGGGYLGLFSTVQISLGSRGPYLIAGLSENGNYRKLRQLHSEVLPARLVELGWEDQVGAPCAVLEGELLRLPRKPTRAKAGYLMTEVPAGGDHGLEFTKIPARSVLIATTTAHPAVAGMVVYRRIRDYLRDNNLQNDNASPVVEIYGEDGLVTVEVPLLGQPVPPPAAPGNLVPPPPPFPPSEPAVDEPTPE